MKAFSAEILQKIAIETSSIPLSLWIMFKTWIFINSILWHVGWLITALAVELVSTIPLKKNAHFSIVRHLKECRFLLLNCFVVPHWHRVSATFLCAKLLQLQNVNTILSLKVWL